MPLIAALPSTISSKTPATPMTSATTTRTKSSSSTPSDSSTTPRRQSIESREGRGQEGSNGPADHEQPKNDIAQTMVEQEAQAGAGETLEPADIPHQRSDEALPLLARQL